MCTNFVLVKKNGVAELARRLHVDERQFIYGDFRPGSKISIIKDLNGTTEVQEAVWWLYLQQTDEGLKPHPKYFSANTNHKKLASKSEFKQSRCIIPATAFVESQDGKRPHLLETVDDSAIAFGGLFNEWTDRVTGEIIYSASIITLPGHPALDNIHRKSTPLWLTSDRYDDWLNRDIQEVDAFPEFAHPTLLTKLRATPIDKVMSKKPIGDPFEIDV